MEENQTEEAIIGNPSCPFTNSLANNGALLTNSYGVEHPSQPNYLEFFTGSDQNVYSDSLITNYPFSAENLGAELLHAGYSFASFSENLPYIGDAVDATAAAPGDPASTTDYVRKHNPVANFQVPSGIGAVAASPSNFGSNYLPPFVNQSFTTFATIAKTGSYDTLPTVSFIVPNEQHDDHGVSGGLSGNALLAAGDTWLQNNLAAYAAWAKANDSLLIVTFDEDDYGSINKIPTIFYGANINPGAYPELQSKAYTSLINGDTINGVVEPSGPPVYNAVIGVNHWSILRTIEDLYALPHIGQTNKVTTITDIFTPYIR